MISTSDFRKGMKIAIDGEPYVIVDFQRARTAQRRSNVSTKLKQEKIASVQVCSSNPNLVFSFTKDSTRLAPGSTHRQLLAKYSKVMTISVAYVKPAENKALLSPAEYASVPADQTVKLDIDPAELSKIEFRPFQKGVKLS